MRKKSARFVNYTEEETWSEFMFFFHHECHLLIKWKPLFHLFPFEPMGNAVSTVNLKKTHPTGAFKHVSSLFFHTSSEEKWIWISVAVSFTNKIETVFISWRWHDQQQVKGIEFRHHEIFFLFYASFTLFDTISCNQNMRAKSTGMI